MTGLPDNFDSVVGSSKSWPLRARGALIQRLLTDLAEELQATSSVEPDLAMAVQGARNAFAGFKAPETGADAPAPSGPVERVAMLAADAEFVPDTGDVMGFWEKLQKAGLVSDRVSVWPCNPASPVKPAYPKADGGQTNLSNLQKAGQVIGMMAMMGASDYVLVEGNPIAADAGPDEAMESARVVVQLHGTAVNAEGTTENGTARFVIHASADARDKVHELAAETFGKDFARKTGPKIDFGSLNLDGVFDKNKKATDLDSDLDHA